jgi:hypothetical protein
MTTRPAHFVGLLRFLRRKGRSREDAEDLSSIIIKCLLLTS